MVPILKSPPEKKTRKPIVTKEKLSDAWETIKETICAILCCGSCFVFIIVSLIFAADPEGTMTVLGSSIAGICIIGDIIGCIAESIHENKQIK